jgi:hypothetical protein
MYGNSSGGVSGRRAAPIAAGCSAATNAEILEKEWKRHWRFKIRLRDVEFMDGNLCLGVSLGELMHEHGAESFRSTSENAARGHGNTDPRRA